MIKNKTIAAAAAALTILATGCSSVQRSPLTYFNDIDQELTVSVPTDNYAPVIRPDDELFIVVLSDVPSASSAYNLPLQNPSRRSATLMTGTPQQQTYVVNNEGDIMMPVIGKIHVAGLTTEQLRAKLTELISKDVVNPEVYVRLVNFRVNVAGEVKSPGPQQVTTERYSILDALTAAGDLTEYGERNSVLLVREENGKREAHRLNLNDADLLTSPYFYLQQNDYVYVEPNKIRKDNSKYNQNNAFKISVISTIVSACSVVASLVIALTVK